MKYLSPVISVVLFFYLNTVSAQGFEHIQTGVSWKYRFCFNEGISYIVWSFRYERGTVDVSVLSTETVLDTLKFSLRIKRQVESGYRVENPTHPDTVWYSSSLHDSVYMFNYFNDTLFLSGDSGHNIPYIHYSDISWYALKIPLIGISASSSYTVMYNYPVNGVTFAKDSSREKAPVRESHDTLYYLDDLGVIYSICDDRGWDGAYNVFRLVEYCGNPFDVTEYLPEIDTMLTRVIQQPRMNNNKRLSVLGTAHFFNLKGREVSYCALRVPGAQILINRGTRRKYVCIFNNRHGR